MPFVLLRGSCLKPGLASECQCPSSLCYGHPGIPVPADGLKEQVWQGPGESRLKGSTVSVRLHPRVTSDGKRAFNKFRQKGIHITCCHLLNNDTARQPPPQSVFLHTIIYSRGHGSVGQLTWDGQGLFQVLLGVFPPPWANSHLGFFIIVSGRSTGRGVET